MYGSTKLNFYLYFYLSPYLRLYLFILISYVRIDSNQFTVYTEAGMHSRRGAAIFFRGASGRRLVPLAEELYQSRDSALRERDTLSDKLCTHRVSRKVEYKRVAPGKYGWKLGRARYYDDRFRPSEIRTRAPPIQDPSAPDRKGPRSRISIGSPTRPSTRNILA